jgi:polysaccharide export outer membrane protein
MSITLASPSRTGRALLMASIMSGVSLLALSPALADPYHVGPGDILAISAYGDAALSGQFAVDDNGTIGYPILGHVAVAGLTTPEIGDMITKSITEHVPGLSASVSISSYAPVFVLGDVTKPGSYQYRPGMIALELVVLGGGIPKTLAPNNMTGLQFIAARQDYGDLALTAFSQRVKLKRVQAERDGAPFTYDLPIDTPQETRAEEQQLIDAERFLFDVRQQTFKSQEQAMLAQEDSFKREIASVEKSIALHDEEISSLQEDVDSAKALLDKGLGTETRYRAAQRELSATKRDSLDLETAAARAQQSLLDVGLRIATLQDTRSQEAATNLSDIALELARTTRKMQTMIETMGELSALSQGLDVGVAAAKTRYVITRLLKGAYVELPADEQTAILPGDILQAEVERAVPKPTPGVVKAAEAGKEGVGG